MTTQLKLVPQVAPGISATPNPSVVATQLDGGLSRYRKDVLNASVLFSVNWILNEEQYEYFTAFFRSTILDGSLPFTIDLAIYESSLKTYTAHFTQDAFTLNKQEGNLFYVNAVLEVEIDTPDYTALDTIVSTYNANH